MLTAAEVHAAVLSAPVVVGHVAETAFAAQLLDRQAWLSLLDESDDLFFGEAAFSHVRHSQS